MSERDRIPSTPLHVTINGRRQPVEDVPNELMMLDYLHEYRNLTGTRYGCGIGLCRACTVIVDHEDGTSENGAPASRARISSKASPSARSRATAER